MTLAIAMGPMRDHAIGRRLGPLIAALPAWRELVRGFVSDPVRDLDWVYATGPGLAGSARGLVMMRASAGDRAIDDAVEALAKRSTAVVPFELGVYGARGTLATLDEGARVLIRAHPSVVAAAPPDAAKSAAATLVRARVRPPADGALAMALDVARPYEYDPHVPASIRDARVRVTPRADGGADVTAEGDCDDAGAAATAADAIRRTIERLNGFLVRLATANLLDGVVVATDGARVTLRLAATRIQLQATLSLAASMLGADIGKDA